MENVNMIPVYINIPEDKCPSCGRTEDKIEVCKNCGYEYKDETSSWSWIKMTILIILGLIVGSWFFITIIDWLTGEDSLRQVLRDQWYWFTHIRF